MISHRIRIHIHTSHRMALRYVCVYSVRCSLSAVCDCVYPRWGVASPVVGLGHWITIHSSSGFLLLFVSLSAKGREWDIVFLKGFNEGVLPLPSRKPEQQPLPKRASSNLTEDEKSSFPSSTEGSNKENNIPSRSSSSSRSNQEIITEIKENRSAARPLNHLEEERRLAYVVCWEYFPDGISEV